MLTLSFSFRLLVLDVKDLLHKLDVNFLLEIRIGMRLFKEVGGVPIAQLLPLVSVLVLALVLVCIHNVFGPKFPAPSCLPFMLGLELRLQPRGLRSNRPEKFRTITS